MVAINIPARTGGTPPDIILPGSSGGGAVDLTLPRTPGPQGPPGARSTDIGFSLKGAVPPNIGTIPVTEATTLTPEECLAKATGTGVVSIDLDGSPVGTVTFPGATFALVVSSLARGFLNFTSTGSLTDLSLALAGER